MRARKAGAQKRSLQALQTNEKLHMVLHDVQQASICFGEVVKETGEKRVSPQKTNRHRLSHPSHNAKMQRTAYHRSGLARVLSKLQGTYVNLFEKMLAVMLEYTMTREEETSEKANALDSRTRGLEDKM